MLGRTFFINTSFPLFASLALFDRISFYAKMLSTKDLAKNYSLPQSLFLARLFS